MSQEKNYLENPMKVRLKFWPAFYGKWEVFQYNEDRFQNKEVDIDPNILIEYSKVLSKLNDLSDKIWREYNKK